MDAYSCGGKHPTGFSWCGLGPVSIISGHFYDGLQWPRLIPLVGSRGVVRVLCKPWDVHSLSPSLAMLGESGDLLPLAELMCSVQTM